MTINDFVNGVFVRGGVLEVDAPVTIVGQSITRGAGFFATEGGVIGAGIGSTISNFNNGVSANLGGVVNADNATLHNNDRGGTAALAGSFRASDANVGAVSVSDATLNNVSARGFLGQDQGAINATSPTFSGTVPAQGHLTADRAGYVFANTLVGVGTRAVATSSGVAAFITTLPCVTDATGVCLDD